MLNYLMSSSVAAYGTDAEGLITFYNNAAADLWGRRPELGSERWCGSWKLFHADGRPMLPEQSPVATLLLGQPSPNETLVVSRPDGTRVSFKIHSDLLLDDNGAVAGTVNILTDETDRVAMEAADARLAAIVSSSDDAIIGKTLDGTITSWNDAATKILGYSAQEMIGQSIRRIIPADLQAEEDEILRRLKQGEHIRHFETVREVKGGQTVELSITVSPVRDKAGRLVGASKVARDITARKHADLASARLAAIVETSDDAIISKDLNGIVTSWNASATRMFGYPPEEMIGQSIRKLIPPELQNDEDEILTKLRQNEQIDHFDTVRVAKDGSRLDISLTISPIHDAKGRVVGASKIARNVTERKQHEKLQRLLFDELNHRVKNTLATIQSLARQSLRTSASPSRFVDSFVGRIQALARAHDILVEQKMSGMRVADLVRNQVALGDKGTQITFRGPDVIVEPRSAVQLGLVLHELATNARKFGALSLGSGHLDIAWEAAVGAGRELLIRWNETGAPMVSAPTAVGFGTTIIERSLAPYGGSAATHYSASGISCDIRLPLPDDAPLANLVLSDPNDLSFSGSPPPSPGPKILIVEDEPLLAMEIEAEVEENNFRVAGTAYDLETARKLIASGEIDAVLLDANLGGRRVDELAGILSERGIPFVFVTGYGRDALPAQFNHVPLVSKPFDPKRLVLVLNEVLRRQEATSQPRG